MRSFYGQVFLRNASLVEEIAAALPSLSPGEQAFVSEALRRCAAPHCLRVLKTAPTPAASPLQKDPAALDDLWAAFFATGESAPVEEIIAVLAGPQQKGDVNRVLTAGVARWSLASNAYQHGRVLKICEEAAARSTGPARQMLEVIVDEAKVERARNPPPEPGPRRGGQKADPPTAAAPQASPPSPGQPPGPSLAGFWKENCKQDFGLWIAQAGGGLYSISFCGPGGCFEPGTYRPNSAIVGDPKYRVKDAQTIEVLGLDGFAAYTRCADKP
jgi:hypothetical protein